MAEPGRPTPFTDYIRSLTGKGRMPETESLHSVLRALRRSLIAEIRRRGLWESPPSYLGVYGVESWNQGGGQALEDLLTECYTFIFIQRLQALRDQLRAKPNIEGLVILNIRHFLHERQREGDPLGFRIYESLRKAIRRAVDRGELRVLAGDPRVRNETVLGFRGVSATTTTTSPGIDLSPLVRHWNDELLPDLVTAQGRGRQSVLGILGRLVCGLEGEGVETLRFKDLIDPIKDDVRARWAAALSAGEGQVEVEEGELEDSRVLNDLLRPDLLMEARDSYRKLVACIAELVDRFAGDADTRRYLADLWMYLRTSAAGEGEKMGKLPSFRQLAGLLKVPRERLPALFGTLRKVAEQCRAVVAGKISVLGGERGHRAGADPKKGSR